MPGGMGNPESRPKDKTVEHALNVTLEELYTGTVKKMKIKRTVCFQ